MLCWWENKIKMPGALTKETAAALLASSRHDPAILPQLEAYVDQQCKDRSYDLDANLAVLKLYQFHPDQLKVPTVAKVLAKALMNLPATDYLACTYMLSDRVLADEQITGIVAAASKLEAVCLLLLTPSDGDFRAAVFRHGGRRFGRKTVHRVRQAP